MNNRKWQPLTPKKARELFGKAAQVCGREVVCQDCGYTFVSDNAQECFDCGSANIVTEERCVPVNFNRSSNES